MLRPIAAAALALTGTVAVAQDSDPDVAFNNNCRTCHSRDEGDNRLGPNLYEIVGREAGTAEGYAYSDALAGADFTWDEATLDEWIADPDSVLTGHKMKPYSGIAEAETRAAIIAALGGEAADGGDAADGEDGEPETSTGEDAGDDAPDEDSGDDGTDDDSGSGDTESDGAAEGGVEKSN